jgi:hypothetical protein
MSESAFYPQDGALYRHPSGRVYRVLMTASRFGDAQFMTVFQMHDESTSPWVMETESFGKLFTYIPNWIEWMAESDPTEGQSNDRPPLLRHHPR